MEVYFGNKTKVSSIRLNNVNGPPDSPSKLQIFYSDDGLAWYAGDKVRYILSRALMEKVLLGIYVNVCAYISPIMGILFILYIFGEVQSVYSW